MFSSTKEAKQQVVLNNLSKQAITDFDVTKAFKSAYALSMPLLAAALMGDKSEYEKVLKLLLQALKSLSDKPLAAWLWGRVYAAANLLSDKENSQQAGVQLKTLLADSTTEKNEFTAWAWGYYLADEQNGEYKKHKNTLFDAAVVLTKLYSAKNDDPDLSTNAMWAWVMAIQAAANNGDADMYTQIKAQMLEMTGQATIAAAFAKGLCKDDYPAWAQGIVYRAAVKMTDETVASGLKEPLLKAIQEARLAERAAEAMLGELTAAGFEISVPKQVVTLSS